MHVVINTAHVEVSASEIKIFDWQSHNLMSPLIVWLKGQTEEVHFLRTFSDFCYLEVTLVLSLVPRPHPARRGSGDIQLIPWASLKIHSLLYA